ncbi:glycosyltransferase [Pontibacter sp. JH31]|uniref:Glycosyltransferase n=1 Tax=Pontibacter aquaedesilientis TaxID=2766980 RepID=A0ABR7XHF9_9BACT|nr:glycosyltransferase [Pontibacter aquaedesilientis]MBD1397717.1 glycosyltransferase [Pontibacter aquaedesilientis]
MKVLFVCSGNSVIFPIVPFIKSQGESLKAAGIEVDYFPLKGKGFTGYIKAGLNLRKVLKLKQYDVIHAHYTLSGWAAVIGARNTPVVISLMGSDAYGQITENIAQSIKSKFYQLLTYLIQPFVTAIISKSENIEKHVYLKRKSTILPNGVNTNLFRPTTNDFRQELGLHADKIYILFLGNRDKPIKNYTLAREAVALLNMPDVELINPYPLDHADIPSYLNSVNVLVVPSLMEGSPNVVKEAMACNCPIVATDVGDIKWVIGDTDGCHLSDFNPEEFAAKLKSAIAFSRDSGRTNGINRINELGLSAEDVANKLIDIYDSTQAVSHKKASRLSLSE